MSDHCHSKGGLTVFCDFDSVQTNKKMFTIIRNYDILWRDGDGVGYLYSRDTLREEDDRLNEIIRRTNYRCVQKVFEITLDLYEIQYQHKNSYFYFSLFYNSNNHCNNNFCV